MTSPISGSSPLPYTVCPTPAPAPQPSPPVEAPSAPVTSGDTSQAHTSEGALPTDDLCGLTIPVSDPTPTCNEPVVVPYQPAPPSLTTQGRTFSSIGDPHETSGDGGKFDNMKTGDFIKARSAAGDFELQTRQAGGLMPNPQTGALDPVTVNQAVGMRMDQDLIQYDARNATLAIDGVNVPLYPIGGPGVLMVGQTFGLPSGGTVTRLGPDSFQFTSAKGDKVVIDQVTPGACNVSGEVAPSRQDGEVKGALGAFDYDKTALNDLATPDGRYMEWNAAGIDAFLESWRVASAQSLLPL